MVSRGIMARSQSGHGCSSLVRMPAHSPDISLAPPPGPPNYPPNESLAWPLFSSTAHILGPPRFAERILPTPPSPPLFLPTYFYLFSCESTEPRLTLVLGSCCGIQMLIQKRKGFVGVPLPITAVTVGLPTTISGRRSSGVAVT